VLDRHGSPFCVVAGTGGFAVKARPMIDLAISTTSVALCVFAAISTLPPIA